MTKNNQEELDRIKNIKRFYFYHISEQKTLACIINNSGIFKIDGFNESSESIYESDYSAFVEYADKHIGGDFAVKAFNVLGTSETFGSVESKKSDV